MNVQERRFEAAKASLTGDRKCNQDRCLVLCGGETVLLGLADGLGGHPRGEVAAQLLIDVCESLFRRARKPLIDPERFMLQCIGKAHQAIIRFGRRQAPPVAPRTTAVLAVIQDGTAFWAHVGDSRLYLIRMGKVHHQTRDHAQTRFVRQSASEPSRPRSSLTRCLGGLERPPTTTCGAPTRLQQHDTIVLCSDGLWGQVSIGALAAAFDDTRSTIDGKLDSLVKAAATRPNSDNVTAVALRWLADTAASADQAASPQDPQLDQAIQHLKSMLAKTRNSQP